MNYDANARDTTTSVSQDGVVGVIDGGESGAYLRSGRGEHLDVGGWLFHQHLRGQFQELI